MDDEAAPRVEHQRIIYTATNSTFLSTKITTCSITISFMITKKIFDFTMKYTNSN